MIFTKATKFVYSKSLFNMLFLNEVGPLESNSDVLLD